MQRPQYKGSTGMSVRLSGHSLKQITWGIDSLVLGAEQKTRHYKVMD